VIEEAVDGELFEIVPGSTERADLDLTNIAVANVTRAATIHVYAEMNTLGP
jgi:hypothetical protein